MNPALYEDNSEFHWSAYLLLCVNEPKFTVSAPVYIHICGAVQWAIYIMLMGHTI